MWTPRLYFTIPPVASPKTPAHRQTRRPIRTLHSASSKVTQKACLFVSSVVKLDTKRLLTACSLHRTKRLLASWFALQRYWAGSGGLTEAVATSGSSATSLITFSNLTTLVYVNPKSLQNSACYRLSTTAVSPFTFSNHKIGPHFVHSVTVLSTLKAKCKSTDRKRALVQLRCFQWYQHHFEGSWNSLSLHCLLMSITPFGLHVNQKRELATWIVTKSR